MPKKWNDLWLVEGKDISWTRKHLVSSLLDFWAMRRLELNK